MKIEITSLRVVDCGPLKDVRIDFTDKETGKPLPVVLLAGANGSGKTTSLETMFGLAQMLNPKQEQVPSILGRARCAIMNCLVDDLPFSFQFGRISHADSQTLASENIGYSVLVDNNATGFYPFAPPIAPRLDLTELAKTMRNAIERKRFQTITDFEKRNKQSISFFPNVPSFLYFPHYRAIEAAEGQEIRREMTPDRWDYKYAVVKSFAGSLSSYLIWLDYAEPETFQSVKAFLDELYPDKKRFDINRRGLKAVVHTANGGTHDVDKLSSGEQNLLIMLLELRRRLLPGSIVLIDELENSLHPAFQHRLAQGLLQLQREIPFQLIATTHAETFVDIFGTNATRVLPTPSALPARRNKVKL